MQTWPPIAPGLPGLKLSETSDFVFSVPDDSLPYWRFSYFSHVYLKLLKTKFRKSSIHWLISRLSGVSWGGSSLEFCLFLQSFFSF